MLAYSSGNHAQAVALSGRLLGVPTVIVMPTDSPEVKLNADGDGARGEWEGLVTFFTLRFFVTEFFSFATLTNLCEDTSLLSASFFICLNLPK